MKLLKLTHIRNVPVFIDMTKIIIFGPCAEGDHTHIVLEDDNEVIVFEHHDKIYQMLEAFYK